MSEKNIGVALVKEACPLCGNVYDGPIVMNTRLTPGNARKVEELNGKTIGFMKEPCGECQDSMSKGFLLIGVVKEKTDDEENPYRSGHIWVIDKQKAKEGFDEETIERGAAFIDVVLAEQIGLQVRIEPQGNA